ncbi:MAG: S46 family peptidase, partial [Daejeonella sp.]|nr:S46 family peptidase [Daejeonella sp.]
MKKVNYAVAMLLAFVLGFGNPVKADEGMWLPMLIGKNYDQMKKQGFKLTPEDLYSVNKASIKDAIVSFGGFCTGEIVSKNGLILTNHHCGYDAVASNSTVENNILDNGFYAKSYLEEKPIQGLFVRFLVRMEDVTP